MLKKYLTWNLTKKQFFISFFKIKSLVREKNVPTISHKKSYPIVLFIETLFTLAFTHILICLQLYTDLVFATTEQLVDATEIIWFGGNLIATLRNWNEKREKKYIEKYNAGNACKICSLWVNHNEGQNLRGLDSHLGFRKSIRY